MASSSDETPTWSKIGFETNLIDELKTSKFRVNYHDPIEIQNIAENISQQLGDHRDLMILKLLSDNDLKIMMEKIHNEIWRRGLKNDRDK